MCTCVYLSGERDMLGPLKHLFTRRMTVLKLPMLRVTGNLFSVLHVTMRPVKAPCAVFSNATIIVSVCTKKWDR